MDFPKTYPKCQNCGCEETIAKAAAVGCKDIRPEEMENVALEKQLVPLFGSLLPAFQVDMLVLYWDVCARCGMKRVIKAEKIKAPMPTNLHPGQGNPRFPHS